MKITSRQIKAAVSVAFLAVLFSMVRRGDFVALLKRVDPLFFALSFVIAGVQFATSNLKWKVLVNLYDRSIGFGYLFRKYLIGYYFSNLLPSNIGGDVVRSYYVGKRIGSQTKSAISVFMERFTGSLYLLLLVILTPLLKPGLYAKPAVFIPAILAAALFLALIWIAGRERPLAAGVAFCTWSSARLRSFARVGDTGVAARLFDRVQGALQKLESHVEGIHGKLTIMTDALRRDRKTLAYVVGLTVLFHAEAWLNVYLAYRTFGVTPHFIDIVALLPVAMLAGSIPVTLGSLGIVEGAYFFYFGLAGLDPASTLAMSLFLRFKMIVFGIVGFLLYLTAREEKFDRAGVGAAAP